MTSKGKYLFIFITVLLCMIRQAKAQSALTPANTIVVTSKAGTVEAKQAIESVLKTDFNNYRLRSAHRKLTFENGVVIELLSAQELLNLGYKVDPMYFREKMDANYVEPLYSIAPNGILIQTFPSSSGSSKSQIH
jgi:hypothetical protein